MPEQEKIKGKRRKRCECCGFLRHDVYRTTDPLRSDLYDDETEYNLCKDCWQELRDDV